MKIALVSEGTYPYAMGGVSVWCDQLIRGLSDYRWEMVSLVVDGSERPVWELPENLDDVRPIPLWGAALTGPDRSGRPRSRASRRTVFPSAYQRFLTTLLRPLDPRSDRVIISRGLFAYALRGLYEYAAQGGDLADALTSNQSLTQLMDAWHEIYGDELTLADALEATWLIEHMLRPLSAEPVKADIVHASMNGLCMLVAMAAKWRYGTPVVMSEHGIYLRERYLSYLGDDAPHAVKVADPQLLPGPGRSRVPDRRRAGAAFQLQPPLAAAERCQPGAHLGDVQRGPARRVPHRRVGAGRTDDRLHGPPGPAQGSPHAHQGVRAGSSGGAERPPAHLWRDTGRQ